MRVQLVYSKLIFLMLILSNFGFTSIDAGGTLRGLITDKETGETIFGANIVVKPINVGTMTDLDGTYALVVKPGTYIIEVTSVGYTPTIITDVVISANESISFNFVLAPSTEMLDEIVLTSSTAKRTEAALLTLQKSSAKLLDAVSSEAMSKTGDGTVATAIKRVTGVSIENGKYVYVRGLGDRYTKTTLNGMTIPGLNPDKNTVQMDLFPTSLVDNIVVYKSFTPDLPGDFTGGMVDISTKDFPAQENFVINLGYGYTDGMNFNKDFVLYNKGKIDWLGFAGKDRQLHFNSNTAIPDESANDPILSTISNGFNKELGVNKSVATFLNQNYSLSFGDQYVKTNKTYGLNLVLNYNNTYEYYDDVYKGQFYKDTDQTKVNLDKREVSRGSIGQNEVLWSALLAGAIKFDKHKYTLSLIHSQSGIGKAADYISQNFDETQATLYKDAIEYSQKSVSNLLLKGKHNLGDNKFELNWKLSPTYSKILEPDVRSTRLSFDSETNSFNLQLGDGAGIDRYYRTLNELNLSSKIDITYKFDQWNDEQSKLKFGISETYKNRDYQILLYQFNRTSDFNNFTEDPNTILQDENLWTATNQTGMYVVGNRDLNNEYQANTNIIAGYVMNELPLNSKLKAIYGLRVENARTNYNGYYNNVPIDSLVHDETALLPSLNLVYKLNKNTNLRGSYSQTVARPSFKEKSNAHIDDPISQTVFIGNIALKETHIKNVDLRWESFFKNKEMISVSSFYKHFNNPIELVPFGLSPNNIQPKNVDKALVYGAELEIRKTLTKEENKLKLDIGSNITYVLSQVNTKNVIVDTNGKTEYELRLENARLDEEIKQNRTMQGQAPFIINAYVNIGNKTGFDTNISYNVQGKKLAIVGSGIVPDVFEDPFHSLSFKSTYKLPKNDHIKVSLAAKNLLNDNHQQYFESYNADKELFSSYSKNRSFSISVSYSFK